jgi:hypothetical protein
MNGIPGEPSSWNRYSYVLANPMNLVDPKGLCGEGAGFIGPTQPCDFGFTMTIEVSSTPIIFTGFWSDLGASWPGKPFKDRDDAGFFAVAKINCTSISEKREYEGTIIRRADDRCSYTKPRSGAEAQSTAASGPNDVGGYHTHSAYNPKYVGEEFSPVDKGDDRFCQREGSRFRGVSRNSKWRHPSISCRPYRSSRRASRQVRQRSM